MALNDLLQVATVQKELTLDYSIGLSISVRDLDVGNTVQTSPFDLTVRFM